MAKRIRKTKGKASAESNVASENDNSNVVEGEQTQTAGVGEEKSSQDDNPRRRSEILVRPGRNLDQIEDVKELRVIYRRLMAENLITEQEEVVGSVGRLEGHQEVNPTIDSSFMSFEERWEYHLWIAQSNKELVREHKARQGPSPEELQRLEELEIAEKARVNLERDKLAWETQRAKQREVESTRILAEAFRLSQMQATVTTTATNLIDGIIHGIADTVVTEEDQRAQARLSELLQVQDLAVRNLQLPGGPFSSANLVDERDRNLVMHNFEGYNELLDIYDPTKVYVMPVASLSGYMERNPNEARVWKPNRESANVFAADNSYFKRTMIRGEAQSNARAFGAHMAATPLHSRFSPAAVAGSGANFYAQGLPTPAQGWGQPIPSNIPVFQPPPTSQAMNSYAAAAAAGVVAPPPYTVSTVPRLVKKFTFIDSPITFAKAEELRLTLQAYASHPVFEPPIEMTSYTSEAARSEFKFRLSLTEKAGNIAGQPKKYLIDEALDALDKEAWHRYLTLPELKIVIDNLSRAYRLQQYVLVDRSFSLLMLEIMRLHSGLIVDMNKELHII